MATIISAKYTTTSTIQYVQKNDNGKISTGEVPTNEDGTPNTKTGGQPAADIEAWVTAGNTIASATITNAMIDIERDRRIARGLSFGGVLYQTESSALENIMGAAQLASLALQAGATTGNLRWADPNNDFVWIASDNSRNPMDAMTMINFAKAVASYKQACIYTGRALKDALAANQPFDLHSDAVWPSNTF